MILQSGSLYDGIFNCWHLNDSRLWPLCFQLSFIPWNGTFCSVVSLVTIACNSGLIFEKKYEAEHHIFCIKDLLSKDLGRFIIQTCPTYNDERWSRRMISKIDIYCQYIILTIWKHDNFCWMTTTFIEKKLIKGDILLINHCN